MNGAELKELRKRHNLTQREMGELIGVTQTRVSELERSGDDLRDTEAVAASEWAAGEPGEPEQVQPEVTEVVDELPSPPYNPAEHEAEPDEQEEEKPKPRRRRASSPKSRGLTTWQNETAQSLIALFCGEQVTLDTGQQVSIPGLCHLLAQVEPYDARVIFDGMPAFAVALVKVAPRHPFLKGLLGLATASGDYQELFQASVAIMLPIAAHHGMLPSPPPPVVEAGKTDPSQNGHVEGTDLGGPPSPAS